MIVDFPSFTVEPGERKEITMRTSRVLVAPKLLILAGSQLARAPHPAEANQDLWILSFYVDDDLGRTLLLGSEDGIPAVVFGSPDQPELHHTITSMALIGLVLKSVGAKRLYVNAAISASDAWSDRWADGLSLKKKETEK
jgi:hypothetical protein